MKRLSSLLVFIFLLSCSNLEPKNEDEKIARVDDQFLYKSDIQELGLTDETDIDSSQIVEAYINNWLRKQAYIQHAKNQLSADQINDINGKVNDYQESLYSNEYEKLMVESKLDTTFTTEQIETYYNKNSNDFLIQESIYRIIYIKKDKPFNNIKEIGGFLDKYLEEGNDSELNEYCLYNTITCSLDTQKWVKEKEILETFNIKKEYLSNSVNSLIKLDSDDGYYYLYQIIEKKNKGVSPIELVEPTIKNILLKIREREFVEELRNEIFEQKKSENKIETY